MFITIIAITCIKMFISNNNITIGKIIIVFMSSIIIITVVVAGATVIVVFTEGMSVL